MKHSYKVPTRGMARAGLRRASGGRKPRSVASGTRALRLGLKGRKW